MSSLQPAEADQGVLESTAFVKLLRSSRKVRQGRLNNIFRHDEPSGFQTWVGGPRLAVRPGSLTLLRVLAHDAPVPARVMAHEPSEPPSAAWLFTIVELGEEHGGGPLMVEVPHTRAAASVPLPVEVSLALGGPLVEPARWYDDPDHFDRENGPDQPWPGGTPADDASGGPARAAQSLIDLRLMVGERGALVSGIVEHTERVTSLLGGELTTITMRTAFDMPLVVWCAATDDPPPPGAVFDGTVALSGSSPQLV
ncbi:MAG: hypothetical protein ACE367_01490 [Acidimicrobiales bacterium]